MRPGLFLRSLALRTVSSRAARSCCRQRCPARGGQGGGMAPRNRPWLGRPWPGQQCEAAELIRACRCAAPEVASLGAEGATACVPPARQPPTLCAASLPPERCGCRSRWPSGARLSSSEVPREGSAGDGGGFGEPVLPFGLEGGILLRRKWGNSSALLGERLRGAGRCHG